MKTTKKLKWLGIVCGYILLIFILSWRNPGLGKYSFIKEILSNLAHIPLYAGLSYFIIIFLKHLKTGKSAYVYAVISGMIIAVIDEFLQSFVPARTVSGMDLLLDLTGICSGLFIFIILRFLKIKRKIKSNNKNLY
ncbi:MAG: VanZ family protein [Candidatus Omnitrophota bacterium]